MFALKSTFKLPLLRPFAFSSKVFISGIPTDWDKNEVFTRFGIAGKVKGIHLIKNALGHNSGKVVVEYTEKDGADKAIQRFNNQAVEGLICLVKPHFSKEDEGEHHPRLSPSLLARRVYLMNLPYDASVLEVEEMSKSFAEVDQVVIPRNKAGLAQGYAFVYLKHAKDVEKFIEFIDGRHMKNRQIR